MTAKAVSWCNPVQEAHDLARPADFASTEYELPLNTSSQSPSAFRFYSVASVWDKCSVQTARAKPAQARSAESLAGIAFEFVAQCLNRKDRRAAKQGAIEIIMRLAASAGTESGAVPMLMKEFNVAVERVVTARQWNLEPKDLKAAVPYPTFEEGSSKQKSLLVTAPQA